MLERTTIEATGVDALDSDAVRASLEQHQFARISGLIAPEAILEAKELLKERFSSIADNPSVGEDPADLQDNFQKLSIGGAQGYGTYRPRCLRTIYNPIWAEDVFGMREHFRTLARTRNLVYGLQRDFAVDAIEDGMWTAARLHHYPRGGGFLVAHKDNVVPRMQEEMGYPAFYQVILVMSKRGVDFDEGGGFAEVDGQRHYFEGDTEYGDIVIYDGRTEHGVADIDPGHVFRHDSIDGRIVAFATLYKTLQKGQKVWQGGAVNARA